MKTTNELDRIIKTYGENALISIVKNYNIIHLDNPTEEQIKQRIKEVLGGQIDDDLEDDCPLCQEMKDQPCDIVYYKQ